MLRDSGGEHGADEATDADVRDEATPSAALVRLLDARARDDAADVGGLLYALGEFLTGALAAEDARLRGARFPGADEHLHAHAALRAIFADLVKLYARHGDDPRVPRQAQASVRAWAEDHAALDVAFSAYERSRHRAA